MTQDETDRSLAEASLILYKLEEALNPNDDGSVQALGYLPSPSRDRIRCR
jgi:hypothetical protein